MFGPRGTRVLAGTAGACRKVNIIMILHSPHPRVGEVVVIADPAEPRRRGSWALGKITRLIESPSDKQVCAVALKTATRQEVHRPVSLLYPFELQSAPDDERSFELDRDCPPQDGPQPVRPPRQAAAIDALARIAASTEH